MPPTFTGAQSWAPHRDAAPANQLDASTGNYESVSNGTLSCCGGWQFLFVDVTPGHRYRLHWAAEWRDLDEPTDALVGHAYWGEVAPDVYVTGTRIIWDCVSAEISHDSARFGADLVAPSDASHLTVRCTLRWTARGRVTWPVPHVEDLGPHEERWRAIQRTRALDNQLCMVVARNMGRGSCIIDRSGEILAYNDGTKDYVAADVQLEDDYRKWNGGCFRQVNWRQRRPHLYSASTNPEPEALRRLRSEVGITS